MAANGAATEWTLRLSGRPTLVVHDTRWNNEERDLVLYQPTVVPEIPAALSNLGVRGVPRAAWARATR
ncbi:hypothetical protein GCM10010271_03720 [Streptomyces kurssanovii]|nr:hypothetical protein GCM10010271_03720 [Streptomyces kurssanovii]